MRLEDPIQNDFRDTELTSCNRSSRSSCLRLKSTRERSSRLLVSFAILRSFDDKPAPKQILTNLAGIGLSLFVAELTGVYFTGGSLNPARSFGPAVVNTSFVHYHWIYWLGPVLGSVVAAGFYKFIKILEYETANPDQDMDHAAKVQRKKNLLMAAGINEVDAHQVANELQQAQAPSTADSEKTVIEGGGVGHGGPDGKIVANGQGRSSLEFANEEAMYGTGAFRGGSSSTGTDKTAHEERPSGPGLTGRYSYLGKAGHQPLTSRMSDRTDSPAIASHNEVFAAHNEPDVALGGMVSNEPRNRFARTASSGV